MPPVFTEKYKRPKGEASWGICPLDFSKICF